MTQPRGIRVKDDATGDVVATRTARIIDELGNKRVVELVDFAGRPLSLRKIREVNSVDNPDLTVQTVDYAENLMPVGDHAGVLVVFPYFGSGSDSCQVTPIFHDSERNNSNGDKTFSVNSNGNDGYLDPVSGLVTGGNYVRAGRTATGIYEAFWRHQINISRYPIVNGAYLRPFVQSGGAGGGSEQPLYIYMENAINGDFPANYEEIEKRDWIGPVAWDVSGTGGVGYEATSDFAELLQSVLNRDDFAWGDNVLLRIGGQEVDGNLRDLWFGSYISSQALMRTDVEWMGYGGVDVDVVGIGETKSSAMGAVNFRSGGTHFGPFMAWDIFGGGLIGLHVTALTGDVRLYAGVI